MTQAKFIFLLIFAIILTQIIAGEVYAQITPAPENVLVVMNNSFPESVKIGEYYQSQRGIPQENMVYLNLGWTYTEPIPVPYSQFEDRIKIPLQNYLTGNNLKDKILYIVMTYGIPYTVKDADGLTKSLDSFLVDLFGEYPSTSNPYFDSRHHFSRANGDKGYLVTRLDGPLAQPGDARYNVNTSHLNDPLQYIKNLVDYAIWAENNLNLNSGKGYFDFDSNPAHSNYPGIKESYAITKNFGFDAVLDANPQLFGTSPAQQFCDNALWYDGTYSYFYNDAFNWVKGAVAYHINSWSAVDIRGKRSYEGKTDWTWVPGLIRDGITGTVGYVNEPGATHIVPMNVFFSRFFHGFNFAESSYAGIWTVKWMHLVIGDPLYSPFKGKQLDEIAPVVNITLPADGEVVWGEGVQLEGTVQDNTETLFFLDNYYSKDNQFQYLYEIKNGRFSFFNQLVGVSGYSDGEITLSVSATDSSNNTGKDSVTFTWVYIPAGLSPPAFKDMPAERTADEGGSTGLNLQAWCLPNDTLTFSAVGTLPKNAKILQTDPQYATFLWTPDSNQAGIYDITFKVEDNSGASDTATVRFIITDVKLGISDVTAINITDNSAIITWTTEKPANSRVQCAVATTFPRYRYCGWDDNLIISHSLTLTSLGPNTTYYYKTISIDAEGKTALSSEYSFTTLSTPQPSNNSPVFNAINNKSIKENEQLTFIISAVDSDEDILSYSAQNIPQGASFNASTRTFSWRPDYSQSGIYNITFSVSDNKGGQDLETITITVVDVDNIPPTISNVSSVSITSNSAVINWTTNESATSQVKYGKTTAYGFSTTINTTKAISHSIKLSGLSTNTTYHYQIISKDSNNNIGASLDHVFTTLSPVQPTNNPPILNQVAEKSIKEGELLSFNILATDKDGDSLTYSLTNPPQGASFNASTRTFSWRPDYSQSGIYNITFSVSDNKGGIDTETTIISVEDIDNIPPAISQISVFNITANSATISWTTNETSDSQIEYSKTTAWENQTILDPSFTNYHSVILLGLTEGTKYNFRVISNDKAKNKTISESRTFTTSTTTKTVPELEPTSESKLQTPAQASEKLSTFESVFTKILIPGTRNEEVKKLQEFLSKDKEIYPEGKITGYYGFLTQRAVQRFQLKYNIISYGSPNTTGYGRVGPRTMAKLNELILTKSTPLPIPQDTTSSLSEKQALIEELKNQIKIIQEKIVQLLAKLIQLLQQKLQEES